MWPWALVDLNKDSTDPILSLTGGTGGTSMWLVGNGSSTWQIGVGGSTNSGPGILNFYNTTGNMALAMAPSGNVGIGTYAPAQKLTIGGGALGLDNGTGMLFKDTTGTYRSVANANADNSISYGDGGGWTALRFFPGSSEAMRIAANGNVGIGTVNPANKLSVTGTIQAKEVVVSTGWADYVFLPGYRVAPLSEVEAYIDENHHLPGIPPATEVAEKGVGLGEMQAKLLAKIEELTLHVIAIDQRNIRLEQENLDLRANSQQANNRIQALEAVNSGRGKQQ